MKILNKASGAAYKAKLAQLNDAQRYSQFPVHETAFWESIFASAKNAKTAQKVLDEIIAIESEPCIDNERVWRNVKAAKSLARIALLN